MVKPFLLWCSLALVAPARAEASCAGGDPIDIELEVTGCKVVDTKKVDAKYRDRYAGILVSGKTASGQTRPAWTGWIPAAASLTCKTIQPTAIVEVVVTHACCDGDPNPPCYLDTSTIFADLKVTKPAKPRKPARPRAKRR